MRALLVLVGRRGFRRLLGSRIASQGSDGVFQVALASHVLFNPEQAADARSIAAAFAVVLLPYSALGPFTGVLLDRWQRRGVIVVSQLVRAGAMVAVTALVGQRVTGAAFFAAVLLVFSVNRFVLAGLSAATPHVVERDLLVSANSIGPTCGSIAYLLGGVVGGGLRAVTSDRFVVVAATVGVAVAAWSAWRLPPVGPDRDRPGPRAAEVLPAVLAGFVEAARTLPRRARLLLLLIFVTRLPLGFVLLQTLLLFRGAFARPGDSAGDVLGFGLAAVASAAGFTLAAFVTPWLAPRWGSVLHAARALGLAGIGCVGLGPWLTPWTVTAVGFVVSFSSQSVKINVDTLLQEHVVDGLLGRAFSIYDVLYNAGLVAAAALAAATLPPDGASSWPFPVAAVGYAAVALALGPLWRRAGRGDDRAGL
ncbi:MAG TPA: MFS transporter [Intrasporangium sp.]|uniref:MFS transporter n=1 Tax=Intrasporangium sp. TaxID=1925024 RepID=UPI002D797EBD|nr:MFS transporter [Intrasporangium sp.]HET7398105.1 MFS transporter [Intrasporangium sp.]